jgi:hypothetical protein
MADYEPIWEGWKLPPEDNTRPWRLIIQPKPRRSDREAARAELEELFRHAPGVYPGTFRDEEVTT